MAKIKILQNSDKDEMGDNLKAVNLGNNVKIKAIALGSSLYLCIAHGWNSKVLGSQQQRPARTRSGTYRDDKCWNY